MEKAYYSGLKLWTFISLCYAIRLYIAWNFPLTNDEAYYKLWSRELQWGYVDHPPGVAYLIYLSSFLSEGLFGIRILGIALHFIASLMMVSSLKLISKANTEKQEELLWTLLQIVPIFSLWGVFALPDTGLYFGLSLVLYTNLKIHESGLTLPRSILLGLGLGISGLFKFHALPVAGGMTFWLFLKPELWTRLLPSVFLAGVIVLPFFIWNALHDWASIRFQSEHGFATQKSFTPLFFLQVRLGEIFFVTPLIYILGFKSLFHPANQPWKSIAIGGFLPLVGILFYSSLWKQNLPHWIMPSFWIILIFTVHAFWNIINRYKYFLMVYASVVLSLIVCVSQPPFREYILRTSQGNPKALSELTLWPYLAKALTMHPSWEEWQEYDLATPSWFSAAQLSYELRQKVYSTSERPSFIPSPTGRHLLLSPKPLIHISSEFLAEIRPQYHESTPYYLYLIADAQ